MYKVALSVKVIAFVNASRHKKIAGTGNGTKNISEIKYLDLPDEVKSSYDAYSQHGWQGTVKGQSSSAGGKWANKQRQLPTNDKAGNLLTYREFDVRMAKPRDGQRFVVSN